MRSGAAAADLDGSRGGAAGVGGFGGGALVSVPAALPVEGAFSLTGGLLGLGGGVESEGDTGFFTTGALGFGAVGAVEAGCGERAAGALAGLG